MERPITVLVAHDHVGVAAAITHLLAEHYATEPPVNSPAQLRNAVQAWRKRDGWRTGPLVVLLDISFGPEAPGGLEVLPDLLADCPEAQFVMHTMYATRSMVETSLDRGAVGFVDKLCGPTELRQAIEAAAAGKTAVFTLEDVGWGGGGSPPPRRHRPRRPLTRALRRVLGLLQAGRNRREIAEILGITMSGVEASMTRMRALYGFAPSDKVDWKGCAER